ncbi:MAG: L-lactate permease [Syntrophobacteraceae bacterium]
MPFGPVGVPTNMMVTVTKINALVMTRAIGIDMTICALIIPVFMLVVMAGWKKAMEVLPAAMVTGISYAIATLIVTQRVGMELPAIISSCVSMLALAVFLKFWKPASIWLFPGEAEVRQELEKKYTTAQVVKAWSPFVILMAIMGLWGIPSFKNWIVNELHWVVIIPQWPGLHGLVYTTVPGAKPAMYGAGYRWEFFTHPGTAMFISSLLTMVILVISPSRGVKVFAATCKQLRFALITLASVIGIGFVANYSGMSYTLGLTFATYTGMLFPIFSPIIGWLGVFLTGSVTSSAALFGKLQQVTAMQININPVLTTSANLFGGIMGKLISPQSIAVACAATGLVGREPDIFRKTIKYSVMLLGITIAVVLLQAYVVPGLVPRDTMALMP